MSLKAVIINFHTAYSPDEQSEYADEDVKLPSLKRLSDIAYLLWKETAVQHEGDVTNIQHFMKPTVLELSTLAALTRAFNTEGRNTVPAFADRVTCKLDGHSETGLALLGSRLGPAMAFLLLQHKEDLGDKYISEISVWTQTLNEDDRRHLLGGEEHKEYAAVNLLTTVEELDAQEDEPMSDRI